MQVYSYELRKQFEIDSPFITLEQAQEMKLNIGTNLHGCPNSGSDLPTYFPGNEKIQAHVHQMVDNGSKMCYTSTKCSICGATYVCDSSD